MFLLILDFVSRGLYRPVQGVGDLAVFVMVAIVYLGAAQTEETRRHVRVTAVTSLLPKRVRQTADAAIHVLASATMAVVVFAATKNAIKAFQSGEAVAGTVPLWVWPVKFVIVIGCIFYFLQLLINTVEAFQKLSHGAE
jgi:TRAP-type C4-dicarboxylate transport system permease small subunit